MNESATTRRTLLGAGAASAAAGIVAPWDTRATEAATQAMPSGAAQERARTMSEGGLSAAGLERMHEIMAGHVERGQVPGMVTLVSRHGETHVDAIGTMAYASSEPMRRDTIFRIASVTKPIVAAAAMTLVEDCTLRLDEPVDALLPELADRQVLRLPDSPLDDTVPANRPITLRDLLTFRAGYGLLFAEPGQSPIQDAMTEAGVAAGPLPPAMPPDDYLERLGQLPLQHQPGEAWRYNHGSDILGVLIARATGMSLENVLRERIFAPLGMKDTSFSVPADKLDRLPTAYATNVETGELEVFDEGGDESRFASPPVFEAGAVGIVSTVDDLHAFGQMMLNMGEYGDTRILSRPSVEVMTTDQLTSEQKAVSGSEFFPGFFDSHGWGFGVAINTRRDNLTTPGRYGWDGGYGTSWYVDPTEELIGIQLTQRLWDAPLQVVLVDFWTSAYAAIDD